MTHCRDLPSGCQPMQDVVNPIVLFRTAALTYLLRYSGLRLQQVRKERSRREDTAGLLECGHRESRS